MLSSKSRADAARQRSCMRRAARALASLGLTVPDTANTSRGSQRPAAPAGIRMVVLGSPRKPMARALQLERFGPAAFRVRRRGREDL
jgi:hypothetical protein